MAKKDYHLTQTGQEVQDILNEAQRVYQCLPEQVEHPDEGDICFVPAHDENIDLEYVSGNQTEPFLIPEGVHLIKTKIVAPAVANWIVVIRRPQEMGINLITTGEVPEEYVANVGVEPGTTPYIYWYDKDESYLQYLTVYYEVAAVCYEYMNGSWVERTDLAQTLEKAKSAYQKPASGIPAADIADGVIPDVSNFITKTVDDLVNYYTKTQTYTKDEVQQLVSSLSAGAFIPVAELPVASADTYGLKIYLVPSTDPQTQNVKDEFITIRSGSEGAYTYSWEQIGSTAIDLSDYATKDELPQTLVCGAHVIPQPYSETKDVEETAELFGITEQQVRDLFTGKYKYIQFDGVILTVTVTNNDSSWCVKFQDPFDMTEYTLWGMTIAVGFLMLIGTRLQKDSAVLYTEQSLSAAQQSQARQNIGATAPEVFWATYGTTTKAEVDAAVVAGKMVFVEKQGRVYHLVATSPNYYFSSAYSTNGAFVVLNVGTGEWTNSSPSLQSINDKAQTISGNESDTSKYPSTKAVADAIAAGKQVFIAEYGVTTYQDIVTAKTAGKVCFAVRESDTKMYALGDLQASSARFYIQQGQYNYELRCNSDDTWQTAYSAALRSADKVDTIVGNETATNKIPSAKAVYDAIVAGKEVFWATYGTTTASEIDAAVAAGKAVACYYGGSCYWYAGKENAYYWFFNIYSSTIKRIYLYNGSWGTGWYNVQTTVNLSQSVPTDRESTTKYPSTKAVWDAIVDTPVIDDSESAVVPALNLESAENKAQTLSGNETNQEKYLSAKGVADALGKWGVVSQVIQWYQIGNNAQDYRILNPVQGLIPQSNIDLYKEAGAVFNPETGYFELNELEDIAYDEMQRIYTRSIGAFPFLTNRNSQLAQYPERTTVKIHFPPGYSTSVNHFFAYSLYIRIAYLHGCNNLSAAQNVFSNCPRLKTIIGEIVAVSYNDQVFANCWSLENVTINKLKSNIWFSQSSMLTLASVTYMVDNAINTVAITITLHPTAYARCQADTTTYTYNGNTYTGVLAYASAKNITIASAS